MKKGIFFLLFGIITQGQAQTKIPKDTETGMYSYQGVIQEDSTSKEQLYERAKLWILRTLKSSDNMVQLDDKDFNSMTGSGTLIMNKIGGSFNFGSYSYDNNKLNFKVSIFCKQGRIKYIFDNFSYTADKMYNGGYNGALLSPLENLDLNEKNKEFVYKDADTKIKSLISSLTNAVLTTAKSAEKDDW